MPDRFVSSSVSDTRLSVISLFAASLCFNSLLCLFTFCILKTSVAVWASVTGIEESIVRSTIVYRHQIHGQSVVKGVDGWKGTLFCEVKRGGCWYAIQ